MTLRADYVVGAAFVLFGLVVIALSGDLPTGQLSMPGAGFLPMIVAVLLIVFGAVLVLRGKESPPFSNIDWSDLPHAMQVLVITAAAVALYVTLGFIITLISMMIALLVLTERKNVFYAAGYSLCVVTITYTTFEYLLKTPLPDGLLGY
jgi:hypothetical protein